MKQFKIFAVVVAAIALSSCASFSYTSRSTTVNREKIEGTSMVVDVRPDFSKRIATESRRCKSISEAREEAKYLAITNNKCDVIVDPVYKIEKRGMKFKAYLVGFAGYYENPRTMYEDVKLLQNISKEDIEKYLILKDPSVLEMINQKGNSEVINIFEGGKPDMKECCKPAPAPAHKEEPVKVDNKKKR